MKAAAFFLVLALSHPAGATEWEWRLPSGFPIPMIPADNPMSLEKVELGRRLFHDPRLSGNGAVSCASCHFQSLAFSDGRALSPGATGQLTHRNAPGLFNLAWLASYTWANPALTSLERQAEVPLFGDDPVEMGVTDANREQVLDRFRADPEYPTLFQAAFPRQSSSLNFQSITMALATYQRSLISPPARYDRFLVGELALTDEETRGMALFFSPQARCSECHGGFGFTDHTQGQAATYHDAAIHGITTLAYPNRGVFELTGNLVDMNHFRSPSLREIGRTAPYMHDGRYPDLATVLRNYVPLHFTDREVEDLRHFLVALGGGH